MIDSHLYACIMCKKEFGFDDIRYTNDKQIICIDCYKHFGKKQQASNVESSAFPEKTSNIIKVICMDCRYKFSLKKKEKRDSVRCPYCSGKSLMKDETTADKLLNEVSNYDKT